MALLVFGNILLLFIRCHNDAEIKDMNAIAIRIFSIHNYFNAYKLLLPYNICYMFLFPPPCFQTIVNFNFPNGKTSNVIKI